MAQVALIPAGDGVKNVESDLLCSINRLLGACRTINQFQGACALILRLDLPQTSLVNREIYLLGCLHTPANSTSGESYQSSSTQSSANLSTASPRSSAP